MVCERRIAGGERQYLGEFLSHSAQPTQVLGMLVRAAPMLTGMRVILGVLISAAAMQMMSALLFGVKPVDTPTYAAVCVALPAAALIASYLPSRRALRVDPAEALRSE